MVFKLFAAACIAMLFIVSAVHSWGGEKYLWRPLFKHKGNRILESQLARVVLRLAWHLTSVLWLVLASVVYTVAFEPSFIEVVVLGVVGTSFVIVGLVDLIASKGQHIGWPLLTLVGVFALGALANLPA